MKSHPIGVFDSGIGGLSVVRHLRQILPHEDIVYFGDTARVPYGTKSSRTVCNFALEDARFLLEHEPKLIVVACNTASALAMTELERELPVPVVGVVEPGAAAAAALAENGPVVVLGTEATIGSNAYANAIARHCPTLAVIQRACPLFVPLVEEGRSSDDPIVTLTVATYLSQVKAEKPTTCVLGCTHYPLLRDAIARFLGRGVTVVDSGAETSMAVRRTLAADDLLCPDEHLGRLRCFVSDNPARFQKVGSRFLGHEIEQVELVEPERYMGSASLEADRA